MIFCFNFLNLRTKLAKIILSASNQQSKICNAWLFDMNFPFLGEQKEGCNEGKSRDKKQLRLGENP